MPGGARLRTRPGRVRCRSSHQLDGGTYAVCKAGAFGRRGSVDGRMGGAERGGGGIFGLFRGASRRANPRLALRVRPHPPRGPGARRGPMGPEVGPAFQRRSWESDFSNLGVRLAETVEPRAGKYVGNDQRSQSGQKHMCKMTSARSPGSKRFCSGSICKLCKTCEWDRAYISTMQKLRNADRAICRWKDRMPVRVRNTTKSENVLIWGQ
eukprot:gene10068-biopygen12288